MSSRHLNLLDRCITEMDHALRVVTSEPSAAGENPSIESAQSEADVMDPQARALSARLMRVNHSGEVAAQALYRGQALVARDEQQRDRLLEAAEEESNHLALCRQRTIQLGGRVSLLSPGWYLGSFAIGVAAGLAGDRTSLGFLVETERQVAEHLDKHLDLLPDTDSSSRALLTQMRADEIRHGNAAAEQGADELPPPVKSLMRAASKVMTSIAYRL